MSYAICTVIYGVPITGKVAGEIENMRSEKGEDSDYGFLMLYGQGDTVGYCGVKLDEFDEASEPIRVAGLTLVPSEEQKRKARALLKKVPKRLRSLAPEPDVYFVISSS